MDKVTVTNIDRIPEWDKTRIKFALEGLNRILDLLAFKDMVTTSKMTETNGLTSAQVYDKIIEGDQIHPLDKKGLLDVEIILYRKSFSKVVGYTFTNSLTVYVNRKYFGGPMSIASNLLHESTHQLGFFHNSTWAGSVPYTMNRIIETLWPIHCKDIDRRYDVWWNS